MTTATQFSWGFPETLAYCGDTYRLVPQTRRDVNRVAKSEYHDMRDLVGAAFDGSACLMVKADWTDWLGWMMVQDSQDGVWYAVLVQYDDQDGAFPHQWCRAKECK